MNPQNQNWSTSSARSDTDTELYFQFHETFYFMYYRKLAILEAKTASEVKSDLRSEISEFFYIYCHGHFLATSFLRDFDRRPIIIH